MPLLRSWIAPFAALAPTVLFAAPLPVQVTKFEGEVVQVAGSAHSGIAPGRNLEAGTEIRTGKDGRAELSLHGDPTLALGSGVALLAHSMDQRVLRLRVASGALRIDTRAAKGGKSRDVRLNLGDLRVRVANADAWTELGERGGQVCLISGTVEVQQTGGVARLDTPGQCLRQSGLSSQWSMVPATVLQERVALLGVREPEVEVAATPAPAPEPVVIEPEPAVIAEPVPPAIETAPAPAAKADVQAPAAVEVVEVPPPPAPPTLEAAPAAAGTAQVALAAPVEVVELPPPPAPPALDPAPAAAAVAALAVPAAVEVVDVPPEPVDVPVAVVETPAAESVLAKDMPAADAAPAVETPVEAPPVAEPTPAAPAADRVIPPTAAAAESDAMSADMAVDVVPAMESVALNASVADVLSVPEPVAPAPPEPVTSAEPVAAAAAATVEPAAAPAATTEVATAAIASPPAGDDVRRWRVVLGSMPEREAAEQESERLNARGWAVEPREYRVGERHGFRIGFGEFATREDAQKALEEFLVQFPDAPAWLAKY